MLDWVDQFWKLRNGLVHGDLEMPSLLYTHRRGSRGYRNHLVLGRKNFTRCVEAFLKLKEHTYTRDIHEELISNEVRLKEAKKFLQNRRVKSGLEEVCNLVSGLKQDDLSATKKQTADFGKIFLPYIIKDLESESKNELVVKMEKILKWQGSDYMDLAMLYDKAFEKYKKHYFSLLDDITIKNEDRSLRAASYHFLDFAEWRLLTFHD